MFSLIIKAVLVSVMWFATGAAACAAMFCKADEDEYNFRRFLTHSILFFFVCHNRHGVLRLVGLSRMKGGRSWDCLPQLWGLL